MRGEAYKGQKQTSSTKRRLCDGKVWAGAPRFLTCSCEAQWNATCNYQENLATARWTSGQRTIGGGDEILSGMRHSPQQTCQSFDSELWYLGDVLYISGTSKCGQFKQYGDLNCKSYHWSRVISENFEDTMFLLRTRLVPVSHYHNSKYYYIWWTGILKLN
jgi:hypothetical protein